MHSGAAGRRPLPKPGFAAAVVLAILRGYKLLISPYFRGSCRFLPSCADYARDAVSMHGAIRGLWLAGRRLARCHPLCEGGHDPVPTPRLCSGSLSNVEGS